ncbi:Alpha/Beta hydrolase protein [Cladorrhinum samala]|uniref:Alpha/Beta hydrolase protein n=1 Tax=Cladorrhinum samala TaxID=585594 RepID=A0AAV9HE51_9PEZI|nr:Alpha/Beta hydrolase protein [Cladorrhinum samala]
MSSFYPTTFKTTDGTELGGRVYPAAGGLGSEVPGVVLCPGFNCLSTMLNFPAAAAALQAKGITVLLYDPRGTGSSGGLPRGDIDPTLSVSDLSDALTHLISLPSVDPSTVGVLGMSFGGAVGLTAAAVDPRIKFVVAAAPLTDMEFSSPAQRMRVLRKCAQDRASQVLGNAGVTVAVVNENGESPVGFGRGVDKEKYGALVREGRELAPGHVNRVTLQTYYRLAMWTPWPLWKVLGKKGDGRGGVAGVMFVIPLKDQMSYPELQKKYYDEIVAGAEDDKRFVKKKLELEQAGHEDILGDEYLGSVVDSVKEFVDECGFDESL